MSLSFPLFLLGELCCQGKGASFSFHNYFLLFRGVVPKLLRQHFLLTLILRVSDPGVPSNSWRRLCHSVGAWTTICNLKTFTQLETNQSTQLQMQGTNNKNRTIRIITIKTVFHHGNKLISPKVRQLRLQEYPSPESTCSCV